MKAERVTPMSPAHLQDEQFMGLALEVARTVPQRTWPNPPVGAVIVQNGKVVGQGAHHGPGTPHAELVALRQAKDAAAGATLYVTLEPCNHQGRTPPCAPAVAKAGIKRVVVAIRDPNPTVIGGGCRYLRERGLAVQCGILARQALELIWPFVVTNNFQRPFVELKLAQSLDGCFAPDPTHRDPLAPAYLTGTLSRVEVHRRRCWMDTVLVGESTAVADRPRLDARLATKPGDGPRNAPRPGYIDTDLSFNEGFAAASWLVVAGQGSADSERARTLEKQGAELIFAAEKNGHADPAAVLVALHEAGINTVMIEGGPRLAAAFLDAGLVDRWALFTAPIFLGQGVRWPSSATHSQQFTLSRSERFGQDTLAVYDRQSFLDVLLKVMV